MELDTFVIDDVDWTQLEHAYGNASDLPPYLHDLFNSENQDKLEEAIYHALHSCACHQYTTYSCTGYVVRCVTFLVRNKQIKFNLTGSLLGFIDACTYGASQDYFLKEEIMKARDIFEIFSINTDPETTKHATSLLEFCKEQKVSS